MARTLIRSCFFAAFPWSAPDAYGLNSQKNDEQRQIRETEDAARRREQSKRHQEERMRRAKEEQRRREEEEESRLLEEEARAQEEARRIAEVNHAPSSAGKLPEDAPQGGTHGSLLGLGLSGGALRDARHPYGPTPI